MFILLPALAIAVAAFCVWLTVRIVNRRERWAKRTAAGMVVVLVVYPLSIGPMTWLADRGSIPEGVRTPLRCFYYPLIWTISQSGQATNIYVWYLTLWGHHFEPELVPAA